MKNSQARIFAAFPVEGEIRDVFSMFRKIYRNISGIRWTPSENLHITLFFIGEVDIEKLPVIRKKLAPIIAGWVPFEIHFDKISFRGKQHSPEMIWAQFEKSKSFTAISEQIHDSVAEYMTINTQHLDPIPHITLARLKKGTDFTTIKTNDFKMSDKLNIDRAELWMTIKGKEGVRYEKLQMDNSANEKSGRSKI